MTQTEKLEALIGKANKNGYTGYPSSMAEYTAWDIDKPYTTFIFSHDFARALFPDPPNYNQTVPAWGEPMPYFHGRLQDAVISDDPIDYMYKVVFGNE